LLHPKRFGGGVDRDALSKSFVLIVGTDGGVATLVSAVFFIGDVVGELPHRLPKCSPGDGLDLFF
jgi:hypothetical protein